MLTANAVSLVVRGQTANGVVALSKQLNDVHFSAAARQSDEKLHVRQTLITIGPVVYVACKNNMIM